MFTVTFTFSPTLPSTGSPSMFESCNTLVELTALISFKSFADTNTVLFSIPPTVDLNLNVSATLSPNLKALEYVNTSLPCESLV